MKFSQLTVLTCLTLFLGACGEPDPDADPAWLRARKELREAFAATRDLAAEKGQELVATMERELDRLDEHIARAREQLKDASDATRRQLDESLARWEEKRRILGEKLQEWKGSSREAWEELKPGVERAFDELQQAAGEAVKKFDDPPR